MPAMRETAPVTTDARAEERIFAPIAGGYDRWSAALSYGQDPLWRRFLVSRLGVGSGGRVLDVASGTAAVARAVAHRYGCEIVGIDQSEEMLAVGRRRIVRAGLDHLITLTRGRAEELPFGDGEFDALTVTYLWRYVDDPDATILELARVVRPGGTIASLEFHVPPNPVARAAWHLHTRVGLPVAGRVIGSGWDDVGDFLGPNIEGFYARHSLDSLATGWQEAGITDVRARLLSLGGAVVMWGVRGGG